MLGPAAASGAIQSTYEQHKIDTHRTHTEYNWIKKLDYPHHTKTTLSAEQVKTQADPTETH